MTLLRQFRRFLIRRQRFPEVWLEILNHHVPFYRYLPEELRSEVRVHMPVFLHEKLFEGCGGLEMTEKMRVIIAAYATLLILGEPAGYYPDLKAILLYPDDYIAEVDDEDEVGIVTEGYDLRSGESWSLGSIVLSWRDIERDLRFPFRGQNLIIHEFAHQLDAHYGLSTGFDEVGKVHSRTTWNEVLAASYVELRQASERGERTLLDPYGATLPAEFFAVATECFFEQGGHLREQNPALYHQLRDFYKLDPATYLPDA